MDKLYTISEVADKLGLATKTLRRWEESGKFVGSRTLGGQRRYSLTDLQVLDAIKHGTIPGSQDLLTIDQAAALFGVSAATVTRWENEGKIHPLITAGITYYPRHRLLEKIDELKASYTPPANPTPISQPTTIDLTTTYKAAAAPQVTPDPPTPSSPINIQPRTPLTPLLSHHQVDPDINHTLAGVALNIVLSAIMIMVYHLIFIQPIRQTPPTSSGLVQGSATVRDPALTLLDSVLDQAGNLKSRSLTSTAITLSPASAPTGVPGTIYFDAGSQSFKYFTSGWNDLSGSTKSTTVSNSLVSGNGLLAKGKKDIKVDNTDITADSTVHITFGGDYSPAKKYWVTVSDGSFTLHTDFPVGQEVKFGYISTLK